MRPFGPTQAQGHSTHPRIRDRARRSADHRRLHGPLNSPLLPDGAVEELVRALRVHARDFPHPSYQPFESFLNSLSSAGVRRQFRFLDYLVGPAPKSRAPLLDIGSGYGLNIVLLRLLGFESVGGIEAVPGIASLSRLLIDTAGSVLGFDVGECIVHEADAECSGLRGESFECVTAIEMVSHASSFDRLLREVNRLLTPGGELLISDGNNLSCPSCRRLRRRQWSAARADELRQRVAFISENFPSVDEQAVASFALHTELYSKDMVLAEVSRALCDDHMPMALYFDGNAPVFFETGQWIERGFFPAELEADLRGYGFDACARAYVGAARGAPFALADRVVNLPPPRLRFLARPSFVRRGTKTGDPTYLVGC